MDPSTLHFTVRDLLAKHPEGLSLNDIFIQTGLPKNALRRIMSPNQFRKDAETGKWMCDRPGQGDAEFCVRTVVMVDGFTFGDAKRDIEQNADSLDSVVDAVIMYVETPSPEAGEAGGMAGTKSDWDKVCVKCTQGPKNAVALMMSWDCSNMCNDANEQGEAATPPCCDESGCPCPAPGMSCGNGAGELQAFHFHVLSKDRGVSALQQEVRSCWFDGPRHHFTVHKSVEDLLSALTPAEPEPEEGCGEEDCGEGAMEEDEGADGEEPASKRVRV